MFLVTAFLLLVRQSLNLKKQNHRNEKKNVVCGSLYVLKQSVLALSFLVPRPVSSSFAGKRTTDHVLTQSIHYAAGKHYSVRSWLTFFNSLFFLYKRPICFWVYVKNHLGFSPLSHLFLLCNEFHGWSAAVSCCYTMVKNKLLSKSKSSKQSRQSHTPKYPFKSVYYLLFHW